MCEFLCCSSLSGGLRMWSVGEHGYSMFKALGLISDTAKARNTWKEKQLGINFSVSMDENLSQHHTFFFLICHLQNAHRITTETTQLTPNTQTPLYCITSLTKTNRKGWLRALSWCWKLCSEALICSISAWNYTKRHTETLLSHCQWVPTVWHTDLDNLQTLQIVRKSYNPIWGLVFCF